MIEKKNDEKYRELLQRLLALGFALVLTGESLGFETCRELQELSEPKYIIKDLDKYDN